MLKRCSALHQSLYINSDFQQFEITILVVPGIVRIIRKLVLSIDAFLSFTRSSSSSGTKQSIDDITTQETSSPIPQIAFRRNSLERLYGQKHCETALLIPVVFGHPQA